ncbi:hypothetical protein [Nocardia nova]|uniref:hypothetical protein n=1 Tax=Nocardia nova TaxID=37330 RepID=UPI0033F854CE
MADHDDPVLTGSGERGLFHTVRWWWRFLAYIVVVGSAESSGEQRGEGESR